MKPIYKVYTFFIVGISLIFGFYYFLDAVYFAPTASFTVVDGNTNHKGNADFSFVTPGEGKTFYSFDKHFMARVTEENVTIYTAGKPNDVIHVELKGKQVSYFDWMPDRNLAIIALYGGESPRKIVLEQFNPEAPDHKIDTQIEDVPSGSRIVDVAYSTATNAVYMKVKVGTDAYRVYRTDANFDTRRINVQATNVGRIFTFYDEDKLLYDDATKGIVYLFEDHTGSWRIINPVGRYRLVGANNKDKTIYIAEVNQEGEAVAIYTGKLGVGFEKVYTYETPQKMELVTVASVDEKIAETKAKKEKSQ